MSDAPIMAEERRYCVGCKNWYFDPGCAGYSEYTPGWAWNSECLKGHWSVNGNDCNQQQFEKAMTSAQECKDYEPKY